MNGNSRMNIFTKLLWNKTYRSIHETSHFTFQRPRNSSTQMKKSTHPKRNYKNTKKEQL